MVGLAAIDAFGIEPHWLDVTVHDVPVQGLPRHLDGFSIAQVTDAHLTSLGRVEEAIVAAATKANVQLIALTGDLIDSVSQLSTLREFCGALQLSGAKVLATLGNWEHWGEVPLELLASTYADAGARLLVNESLILAEGVSVAATDDSTGGQVHLEKVLQKVHADAKLLLTHSPELLDRIPAKNAGFGLSLAGHTHGGQIRLSSKVVPVVPPGSGRFVAGWYETDAGTSYVSRGTGTSIVPARFTCRPELPIFRLRQG